MSSIPPQTEEQAARYGSWVNDRSVPGIVQGCPIGEVDERVNKRVHAVVLVITRGATNNVAPIKCTVDDFKRVFLLSFGDLASDKDPLAKNVNFELGGNFGVYQLLT